MARPKKQEVDYFPHYCSHGKVLFILENYFKNDGYAVFYKIEELLAKTEGHCYDCSLLENWEYLLSKMGAPEETVLAIMEKLASMGVIDVDLWQEKRIWMQSFVDSISDAYARRKVDLPTKPELSHTKTPLNGQNEDINPQSKVKESKVNKRKEKKDAENFILPDWIPQETWEAYLAVRKKKKAAETPYALNLVIQALVRFKDLHNHDPVMVLNKSIVNNWTDVYPLKDQDGINGNRSGTTGGAAKTPQKAGYAQSDGEPYPTGQEF
jgi:hypothetical protein